MPVAIQRLLYRLAAPIAHVFWALRRAELRGAKALLVRDSREVLLVRHTYGDRGAWNLPGGLLRRAEDPRMGAVREVREELGLELAGEARELCVRDLRFPGHVDRVHYFVWAVGEQPVSPRPAEIAEARWFELGRPPRRLGVDVGEVLALLESPTGEPGSPRSG